MNALEMCNHALAYLGEKPLEKLTDKTQAAHLCRQFWPLVRDVALSRHDWKCALVEVTLSDPQPDDEGGVMFILPLEALKVISAEGAEEYEGMLHASSETSQLRVVYVHALEEFSACPEALQEMMCLRLAAALARPLLHDTTQAEQLRRDSERALLEAISQDDLCRGAFVNQTAFPTARALY